MSGEEEEMGEGPREGGERKEEETGVFGIAPSSYRLWRRLLRRRISSASLYREITTADMDPPDGIVDSVPHDKIISSRARYPRLHTLLCP